MTTASCTCLTGKFSTVSMRCQVHQKSLLVSVVHTGYAQVTHRPMDQASYSSLAEYTCVNTSIVHALKVISLERQDGSMVSLIICDCCASEVTTLWRDKKICCHCRTSPFNIQTRENFINIIKPAETQYGVTPTVLLLLPNHCNSRFSLSQLVMHCIC